MFSKILVPLDGSKRAETILPYVEQLAQQNDADVVLLQVLAPGAALEQGPIVRTILDVAERENVKMIAMASHGRTGLARVFYGSVAAGVLHQADRPLLIVRADDV